MSVYVDNMEAEFGSMIMCHMIADTHDQLIEMVDRIGVKRKWIQHEGSYREHFDICLSKKLLAIREGAIEITTRELVTRQLEKRNTPQLSLFKPGTA